MDNCIHRCNVFDLDMDGVFDEFCEQMQPTPKPSTEKPKSELELLGEIQDIVKKSNERNYGDGEREF